MAGRAVVATLVVDGVEGVVAGFKRAGGAVQEYGRVAQSTGKQAFSWVEKHNSEIDRVSGGLLKFGAVGALALAGVAKAAVDWESAWAGVTKTVDGTPQQMAEIESSLRGLAKTLPATHQEIAQVAENAGQLGIAAKDVVGFTKTMIDLGETTNLSSDEAATSLAQFMNVMGTSAKNVDRLGSSVVALGNNGASTERDIVQMGQRIAAAGKSVRMSETDVLGFASALSSTGIEAEAGGTAISKTFRQIDADVREGGKGLEVLAETSGLTVDEFKAAWESDAAGAVATFVEGLGEMQASGGDANAVLKDLGMTGERQTDSIMRLANATKAAGQEQDLLRDALALGGQSWDENTALADEAAKRYETRAAQMQMSINGIKDTAIDLGQALLPVVDSVLGFVNAMVDGFAGVPQSAKDAGIVILGIGTAATLALGGVGKLVVGLANAKAAVTALGISASTASRAFGVIGVAITVAGAVLSSWIGQQQKAKDKVDAYTDAIRQQGEVLGELTRQQAVTTLQDEGVLDWAQRLGVDLATVTDAALGSESALRNVRDAIAATTAATDEQIAANQREMNALNAKAMMTDAEAARYTDLVNANTELASVQSDRVSAADKMLTAIDAESGAVAQAADKALQHADAMGESADETGKSAAASERDARSKEASAAAIQATKEEIDDLIASTQAYGNALLAQSNSLIGMDSSILDAADHMKKLKEEGDKSAYTLDTQTRAGIENQRMLDGIAGSTMNHIKTLTEQSASMDEIASVTQRGKDAWIAHRDALGQDAEETRLLAEEIFRIPDTATTTYDSNASIEEQKVRNLRSALDDLPEEERVEIQAMIDQGKLTEADRRLDELTRSRTISISVRMQTLTGTGYDRYREALNSADGNIVEYHAAGGLRENHVAQIAKAGTWRVWAEDETGGEAYIPLAPSKRPRSLEIWRETGRRLGVQNFADGATLGQYRTAGTASSNSVTQHITQQLSFPGVNDVAVIVDVVKRHADLSAQTAGDYR